MINRRNAKLPAIWLTIVMIVCAVGSYRVPITSSLSIGFPACQKAGKPFYVAQATNLMSEIASYHIYIDRSRLNDELVCCRIAAALRDINPALACKLYSRAFQLDPGQTRAYIGLARVMESQKKWVDESEWLRQVLMRDRHNAIALTLLHTLPRKFSFKVADFRATHTATSCGD